MCLRINHGLNMRMAKFYLAHNITSVIFFKIVFENVKTKTLYPFYQHKNFTSKIHPSFNTIKNPDKHNSIILDKNCFHLFTNLKITKEVLNYIILNNHNCNYYESHRLCPKLIYCKVNVQDILSFGFNNEVATKKYQILLKTSWASDLTYQMLLNKLKK